MINLARPAGRIGWRPQSVCCLLSMIVLLAGCRGVTPQAREELAIAEKSFARLEQAYRNLAAEYLAQIQQADDLHARSLLRAQLLKLAAEGLTPAEADSALALDKTLRDAQRKGYSRIRARMADGLVHARVFALATGNVDALLAELEQRKTAEDKILERSRRIAEQAAAAAKKGSP